jgi:hypothetical protein
MEYTQDLSLNTASLCMKNSYSCAQTLTCGLYSVLTLTYPNLFGTKRLFLVVRQLKRKKIVSVVLSFRYRAILP